MLRMMMIRLFRLGGPGGQGVQRCGDSNCDEGTLSINKSKAFYVF